MATRAYWLNLFSIQTWQEFLNAGASVTRFRENRWSQVPCMADLLAIQPNLNIPLYVVAPEERRGKVIAEVNRPTFSRLTPPLKDACRYISFDTLRERLPELEKFVQYLKPDVLKELSESCGEECP